MSIPITLTFFNILLLFIFTIANPMQKIIAKITIIIVITSGITHFFLFLGLFSSFLLPFSIIYFAFLMYSLSLSVKPPLLSANKIAFIYNFLSNCVPIINEALYSFNMLFI